MIQELLGQSLSSGYSPKVGLGSGATGRTPWFTLCLTSFTMVAENHYTYFTESLAVKANPSYGGQPINIWREPEEPVPQTLETRKEGISGSFVLAVTAVALMLGFALGLFVVESRDSRPLYDEDHITSLVRDSGPAVVEIEIGGPSRLTGGFLGGAGSGFLVDDQGHIVTNQHVVEVRGDVIVKLKDGRSLEAKRLGWSEADDLAVLQVDPRDVSGIKPLVLAESKNVKPGQMAIAIGSPYQFASSVTVGVVSAVGRATLGVGGAGLEETSFRPVPDVIQTDAPLNPGNSGGPILNSDGEVIGVAYAIQLQSPVQSRIGFAIPSDTLRKLLPDLIASVEVRRPWLGISGQNLDTWLPDAVGVSIQRGVYVTDVFNGSPASASGVVSDPGGRILNGGGDVIVAIDGIPMDSMSSMVSYFNDRRPGDTVVLSIIRDGSEIEINVQLAAWPENL